MCEQVGTPEDGIFCNILNIAGRKPGLAFSWSLGLPAAAVTHWKPLGLPCRQKGQSHPEGVRRTLGGGHTWPHPGGAAARETVGI